MFRADMNEVNVESIDLGDEIRHRVELRLDLAPVVLRRPIAREVLDRRKLHPLRLIRDRFPVGPARRADARAQFGEFRVRKIHVKRTNGSLVTARVLWTCIHGGRPLWKKKTRNTQGARSNGYRCGSEKLTAIDAGLFLHGGLLGN